MICITPLPSGPGVQSTPGYFVLLTTRHPKPPEAGVPRCISANPWKPSQKKRNRHVLHYTSRTRCEWGGRAMARVIEFYVPGNFRRSAKWIPPKQRGKVIQFPALQKKSA